jgi:hypothetical protein
MTDSKAVLSELLTSNGLTPESLLYRYTLAEFLTQSEDTLSLSANPRADEAVADVYAQGHVTVAEHVGPGLAFGTSAEDWRGPDRELVAVRLSDVLAQGGKLYPVESVVTCQAFFCTLPEGRVSVRKVE